MRGKGFLPLLLKRGATTPSSLNTVQTKSRQGQDDERHRRELEDTRDDFRENRKVGDINDTGGHAVEPDTSRQNVDGESLVSTRKMQTVQ